MAGKKGKSGRKPSPESKREYIQVRVSEEQKAILKAMAEKSTAGTVSSVVHDLIDRARVSMGGADIYDKTV